MRNQRGITLIELSTVVVIIGVLATLAITQYRRTYRSNLVNAATNVMRSMHATAQIYRHKNGAFYPSSGWLSLDSFNTAHGTNYIIPPSSIFYYTTDPVPPGGFEIGIVFDQGGSSETIIRVNGNLVAGPGEPTDNPCCHTGFCADFLPACGW